MTTTSAPPRDAAPPPPSPLVRLVGPASLVGRLIVGAVLAFAAASKITDPAASVRAVRAYELLPEGAVAPFAHALPWFEAALAALLILGVAVRFSGWVTAALMAMFIGGIASAAARGLKIDCGCFGGGGATDNPTYTLDLVRDSLLLLVAVAVAVLVRSTWAWTGDPGPLRSPRAGERASKAKRLKAERLRGEARLRSSKLSALGVAVLVAASLIGIGAAHGSTPPASYATPAGVLPDGGVPIGQADAPHTLTLFEDPQCPICGEFEKTSGPVVEKAIAAGRIKSDFRLRSFLGPESVRAVAALGAAQDEGKFQALREYLFAHQPKEGTGGYTIDDLIKAGAAVGLTDAQYVTEVRDQKYAAWAKAIDDQASKDGNVGTPELRLDGKKIDNNVAFDPTALAKLLAG